MNDEELREIIRQLEHDLEKHPELFVERTGCELPLGMVARAVLILAKQALE
jgi:hypothetical protein